MHVCSSAQSPRKRISSTVCKHYGIQAGSKWSGDGNPVNPFALAAMVLGGIGRIAALSGDALRSSHVWRRSGRSTRDPNIASLSLDALSSDKSSASDSECTSSCAIGAINRSQQHTGMQHRAETSTGHVTECDPLVVQWQSGW